MTTPARSATAALAAPFVAGVLGLVALPMLMTAAFAFTTYSGVSPPQANGLDNFRRLAADGEFWQAVGNSAVFVLVAVPLRLTAVAVLALTLHRRGPASTAARSIAFLPTLVPEVAMALLWLWMLNPLYGPLAHLLHAVGLPSPRWLTDPWTARVGVALMSVFHIGEAFLVALAWRRLVPRSLFDAAAVDGASAPAVLRRITLPLMAPVLGLLALRDVLLSLHLAFGPALLVTRGGPRRATTTLPVFVYDQAFRYFRLGYAAAISVLLLVVAAVVLGTPYVVARRRGWRWE